MSDRSLNNKYLQLPRSQQFVIIVVVCGIIFIAIECLSWVGLYAVWRVTGKAIIPVEFISEFQPFSTKRIYEQQSEYRPYYMTGFVPNLRITRRTPFGTDRHGLLINNQDQSGRDLNIPSEAYRIFILGNSTIMGGGSGQSFSAYLETVLNSDSSRKYEVVTAGGDGFNSGQELARLSLETIHFHPDMIITFDGVADAFWSSFSNNTLPNSHMLSNRINASLQKNAVQNKSFIEINISSIDFFLRRFYIYNTLLAVFSRIGIKITNPYDVNDQTSFGINLLNMPEFRPEGAQVYLDNLASMAAVSNIRGIQTLHILQPTLATELIKRQDRATDAEWELLETKGVKRNYSRRHRALIFDKFYKLVRAEFRQRAQNPRNELQTWIDFSTFFRNADDLTDVYYDAVHYHDFRVQEIVEEVAVQVRRAIEQPQLD